MISNLSFTQKQELYYIHLQSTLNNTIITLTNLKGDVLYWASAGSTVLKIPKNQPVMLLKLQLKNFQNIAY